MCCSRYHAHSNAHKQQTSKVVHMNADISDTIKARDFGFLSFVTLMCLAYSYAFKLHKSVAPTV